MFVRGPNPIWFYSNLVGQPFDDTYYAFFLTNDLPYLPQAPFMDPNGINPWHYIIEFQPSSGLPNNIFFDPTLVYRIEFRQGPDQTYPLIYLIENYTLAGESEAPVADPLTYAENMITNPQFADVFFSSPYTINAAGTYNIAPGWQLVLSGSGTCILNQGTNAGSSNIVGNPPYYLSVNNSGFTAQLIQTFSNEGAIFGGGAIALSFTALVNNPPDNFTVSYVPSTGTPSIIFQKQLVSSAFIAYPGATNIPASSNTDSGQDAYVNIVFTLPQDTIFITNIQIVGQSQPLSSGFNVDTQVPPFAELTYERVVDHEFHVYKDSLVTESKDNLLVGWTFALNPWQFRSTALSNVAVNQYTADQTIIIQQNYVAMGVGNNVAVGQGIAAQNYGFVVSAVTASNQFAIVQYVDPATIAPYWNQILSSMVNASVVTTRGTAPKFKMRLISSNMLPGVISNVEPIATWTSGQDPFFSGAWTVIKPLNDPVYTLTTLNQNFSFDQFQFPPSTADTMTLGIVIYTITDLIPASPADSILFNRVSLVPNDFAIDASTETYDETYRKCQYYYEKSYQISDLPGTVTNVGVNSASGTQGGANAFAKTFYLRYKQTKRAPAVHQTFYSPVTGAANFLSGSANRNGMPAPPSSGSNPTDVPAGYWSSAGFGSPDGANFLCVNTSTNFFTFAPNPGDEILVSFHYVIDSRLGA